MTPEEKKAHKAQWAKRYRKRHLAEIHEADRLRRLGQSRRWWALACFKAGVPMCELPILWK